MEEGDKTIPRPPREKNVTIVNTLPVYKSIDGGRTGWWEGSEGEIRLASVKNALLMGHSITESAYVAGISRQQFYWYCKKFPEFVEEVERAKMNVIVRARQTILRGVERNYDVAWRFLAKKLPEEFGDNPVPITPPDVNIFISPDYMKMREGETVDELLNEEDKALLEEQNATPPSTQTE